MRGRGELWQSDSFTGCGKRESSALLKLPRFFKSDSVRMSNLFSAIRSRKQAGLKADRNEREGLLPPRAWLNDCLLPHL